MSGKDGVVKGTLKWLLGPALVAGAYYYGRHEIDHHNLLPFPLDKDGNNIMLPLYKLRKQDGSFEIISAERANQLSAEEKQAIQPHTEKRTVKNSITGAEEEKEVLIVHKLSRRGSKLRYKDDGVTPEEFSSDMTLDEFGRESAAALAHVNSPEAARARESLLDLSAQGVKQGAKNVKTMIKGEEPPPSNILKDITDFFKNNLTYIGGGVGLAIAGVTGFSWGGIIAGLTTAGVSYVIESQNKPKNTTQTNHPAAPTTPAGDNKPEASGPAPQPSAQLPSPTTPLVAKPPTPGANVPGPG